MSEIVCWQQSWTTSSLLRLVPTLQDFVDSMAYIHDHHYELNDVLFHMKNHDNNVGLVVHLVEEGIFFEGVVDIFCNCYC